MGRAFTRSRRGEVAAAKTAAAGSKRAAPEQSPGEIEDNPAKPKRVRRQPANKKKPRGQKEQTEESKKTPVTNPCGFCGTHPQGVIAHQRRPCDWVEYGDTKVECRNCADFRSQSPGQTVECRVDEDHMDHRRYGINDPDFPAVLTCNGCLSRGTTNTCDVDVHLGYGCKNCRPGRCRVGPVDGAELRARPDRIGERVWFRHACDKCTSSSPIVPDGQRCTWLLSRAAWNSGCGRCLVNGNICLWSNELIHAPTGAPPASWAIPSAVGPQAGILELDNSGQAWRKTCEACAICKPLYPCHVTESHPFSSCVRCNQLGIDCVETETGRKFPLVDLSKVGFGEWTPFQGCKRCDATGRPCDHQRPCASCVKNGERSKCDKWVKSKHDRIFNCCPQFDDPPSALYYLGLGYGAAGVDTPKDGSKLEDWVGPLTAKYSTFNAQERAKSMATGLIKVHNNIRPGQRLPALQGVMPSELTVEALADLIRTSWPASHAPVQHPDYQQRMAEMADAGWPPARSGFGAPLDRPIPAVEVPVPVLPAPVLPAPGLPAPGLPAPGLPAPGLPAPGLPAPSLPAPGLPATVPSALAADLPASVTALLAQAAALTGRTAALPTVGGGARLANTQAQPGSANNAGPPEQPEWRPPYGEPQQQANTSEWAPNAFYQPFGQTQNDFANLNPPTAQEGNPNPSGLTPNQDFLNFSVEDLLAGNFTSDQPFDDLDHFFTDMSDQNNAPGVEAPGGDNDLNPFLCLGNRPSAPRLAKASRWSTKNKLEGIDMSHWRQKEDTGEPLDPSLPRLLGMANNKPVVDTPARDILEDIPLEPRLDGIQNPAFTLCMEPGEGGKGMCGNPIEEKVGCQSLVHQSHTPNNFLVCKECNAESVDIILDPTLKPLNAKEIVNMRAYTCDSCAASLAHNNGYAAKLLKSGAKRIWGVFETGSDGEANIWAEDGASSVQYHATSMPLTGCPCATKLLNRPLCHFHRLHYAELAMQQAALMQEWRMCRFGKPVCPVCISTNKLSDVNVSADQGGFPSTNGGATAWACLVCNDWVVNQRNDHNKNPQLVQGSWDDDRQASDMIAGKTADEDTETA
ncbi:hypothetical protein EDB80DRAFT_281630 [Ilyonectria destructans]|nr:hypothetical protein EDB80DRAFT_281630 [Ilyonectria destructans]